MSPKIKIRWPGIIAGLVLLFTFNAALGVVGKEDLPLAARTLIKAAGVLVWFGLLALVAVGLLALADRAWRWMKEGDEVNEKSYEVVTHSRGIDGQLNAVDAWLDRVEENGATALARLADAEGHATAVVALITSAMERYRLTVEACALMETAVRALAQNNPVGIMEAAGRLRDPHAAQLMAEVANHPEEHEFRAGVVKHISMQRGALLANADAYRALGLRWLERVTLMKTHACQLEAGVFVIDAARPLALLTTHLETAEQALAMNVMQPQMRKLPGVQRALLE